MKTVAQEQAQHLLDVWTADAFTTNEYAVDKDGKGVDERDPAAVRWCLYGICFREFPNYKACDLLRLIENKSMDIHQTTALDINDREGGHEKLTNILKEIVNDSGS